MSKKEYNSDSIQVLSEQDKVRKNPGMYLGNINTTALFTSTKEILDNAIDEFLGGNGSKILVKINTKENSFLVADMGRGIPVEIHKETKISTLTTVYTRLHAGGKFKAESVSIGTHGVGSTASNYVSKSFEVWTYRDGWYYQGFVQGIPVKDVAKVKSIPIEWKNKGTIVKLIPDPEIFKTQVLKPSKYKEWFSYLVYLIPGLTIELDVDGTLTSYASSENGLLDYIEDTSKETQAKIQQKFSIKNKEVDFALAWTDGEQQIDAYVNCSYTLDGGTHKDGFIDSYFDALKPFGDTKGLKEDVFNGVLACLHTKLHRPQFDSQTKDKLINPEAYDITYKFLKESFDEFFAKNKSLAESIIERAKKLKSAREKLKVDEKAIKNLVKIKKNDRGLLPGKLAEARCRPEERQLYIVEGDSAGGTAKKARLWFQEILSLKGKPPNASKSKMADLLKNEEIRNIIMSTGTQVLDKCKIDELRLSQIIILSDSDPDGCFRGNQRVRLLDGTSPTFKELVKLYPDGEKFWVYSRDDNGNIVPAQAHSPRATKRTGTLLKITLDNGETIQCTENHLFRLQDNTYTRADKLKIGCSLSPLYTKVSNDGREWLRVGDRYEPTFHWSFLHTCSPEEYKKYTSKKAYDIHHRNRNKRDDRPENLQLLTHKEHGSLHLTAYNISEEHKVRVSKLHADGHYDHTHFGRNGYNGSENHVKTIKKLHADGFYDDTHFGGSKNGYNESDKHKKDVSTAWKKGKYNPEYQIACKNAKHYASLLKYTMEVSKETWNKFRKSGVTLFENISNWKEVKALSKNYVGLEYKPTIKKKDSYPTQMTSKFVRVCKQVLDQKLVLTEKNYEKTRAKKIEEGFDRGCKWETALDRLDLEESQVEDFIDTYNHAVVSIEKVILSCEIPVYDLTVDGYHNFALAAGVFVHNSHIKSLSISFFVHYMRPLIDAGIVYVARAPLFQAAYKDKKWFGMSLEGVIKKLPTDLVTTVDGKLKNKNSVMITRLKGWGEVEASDLKVIAMDPNTRKLYKLMATDDTEDSVYKIMGDDSSKRKEILGI